MLYNMTNHPSITMHVDIRYKMRSRSVSKDRDETQTLIFTGNVWGH